MTSDGQPDAEEALPWAPGRPPVRNTRAWRPAQRPAVEVRLAGEWRPGVVTLRQDRADGAIVYHVLVMLPNGTGSPSPRAVIYDPATVRPRPA